MPGGGIGLVGGDDVAVAVAGGGSSSSIGVMGMRGVCWSYVLLSVWIGDAGFGGIADGRG